jgi:hypothetical protein
MSDDLIERAEQIEFDNIAYRKSDCEGLHWIKVNEFWYDEMVACIPKLVAEIRALRAQEEHQIYFFKNEQNEMYKEQLAAKDAEIAKWQAIASRLNKQNCIMEAVIFHLPPPTEDDIEHAAKELSIQISQEDTYLARLEEKYLALVEANITEHGLLIGRKDNKNAKELAQEALAKIRERGL